MRIVKGQMERKNLEQRIAEFLKEQALCVISTCFREIPRASTVEYFPAGTTLYVLTEGGKKIENIKQTRRVSVAVHAPFSGWQSVKGIQITGTAEIGVQGDTVFEEGKKAYMVRKGLKKAVLPDFMKVIKVTPQKIEYLDASLPGEGYSASQILHYEKTGTS
jgi:general stress protein 26